MLQTTALLERSLVEQKKLEDLQKQKIQALERLKTIQRIQEHREKLLENELSNAGPEKEKERSFDKLPLASKMMSRYQSHETKFNPYQVEKVIIDKFNGLFRSNKK